MWRVAHQPEPFPFLYSNCLTFPSNPVDRCAQVACLLACVGWAGGSLFSLAPWAAVQEKLKTQVGGKGALRLALFPSGARQQEPGHCALLGVRGSTVGSQPGIPALPTPTTAFAPALARGLGAQSACARCEACTWPPSVCRTGAPLRARVSSLAPGVSVAGVFPALGVAGGPSSPRISVAGADPARPPARSFRGARRKWQRDPRSLGAEVSGVRVAGEGAGRRGAVLWGGREGGGSRARPSQSGGVRAGPAPAGEGRWRRRGRGGGGGGPRAEGAGSGPGGSALKGERANAVLGPRHVPGAAS